MWILRFLKVGKRKVGNSLLQSLSEENCFRNKTMIFISFFFFYFVYISRDSQQSKGDKCVRIKAMVPILLVVTGFFIPSANNFFIMIF